MFGFFPFNNGYNSNFNRNNSIMGLNDLFNDEFFNGILGTILSSDFINDIVNDISEEEEQYDIQFKEFEDYYLIKGYLPGLTPRDVSIDFEKNKAILTIKRKRQTYTNGNNSIVTVIQSSGSNIVKNFYIGEVDVSKLRASFDNSVLLLTIPKIKKVEAPVSEGESTIIDVDNYTVK